MANKMLIDATHPEETRVVVVRGSRVEEFDFEAANRKQLRGNIYLAKVTRVEPSLQAAFVEYGGNRHGFLAFSEIHPDYYQIPTADRQALLEEEARLQAEIASAEDGRRRPQKAATKTNGDGADADGEDADGDDEDVVESVGAGDAMEDIPERRSQHKLKRQYKIQEVIKRRQVLLVQVVKEERGNKGAALTTYLSLAGRYSVLMPNTARGGGISRKITNPTDRKRLKKIASELEVPEGMGVILRTAGAARTKAEIKRDFEYLLRLWENVRDLTLKSSAPTLVYEEGSLIKRSIRDLYNKDIDAVTVAGDDGYREAKDFMRMLMPSHAKNVQAYKDPVPLFTRYGVENQLDAMFSPQVTLRSGGYIVINQTEALVSIDVNSGRATREHNIEDTALQTNLEAADEVARQLRLRDLAGLIVIDFIDMEEKRNNRSVERRLKEALKNDRARIQVGRISHFGLLEMSRQRLRTGVVESSMVVCPHCGGTGLVRSTESVALHVLRALEEMLVKGATHNLIVRMRANVALYILNQKRGHLIDIETRFGIAIMIAADDHGLSSGQMFAVERGEPVARPIDFSRPSIANEPVMLVEDDEPEVEEPIDDEDEEDDEDEAPKPQKGQPERAREGGRTEQPREGQGEAGEGGRRKRRRRRRRRGGERPGEDGNGAPQRVETSGAKVPFPGADDGESDGDYASDGADDADGDDTAAPAESNGNGAVGEDGEPRRKRRRGRRGGRRNRRDGTEMAPGEFASDEGGEDAGDEGASDGGEADEPVVVSAPVAVEAPAAVAEEPADAEPVAKVKKPRVRKPRVTKAKAAELAAEADGLSEAAAEATAQTTKTAETVAEAPVVEAPAPVAEAPVEEAPAPAPKPVVVVEDPPEDPNRPKRSGWWSRAKSVLGG